jgi:hypothetical protein
MARFNFRHLRQEFRYAPVKGLFLCVLGPRNDSGHRIVWVEVRKYRYVPEFPTSSFLFLGNGTPANRAAASWLLAGNFNTCNLWLPRRAHTHNLFRLRACDNGNPIEIGFLKINFVRGNFAVKTHVLLSLHGWIALISHWKDFGFRESFEHSLLLSGIYWRIQYVS